MCDNRTGRVSDTTCVDKLPETRISIISIENVELSDFSMLNRPKRQNLWNLLFRIKLAEKCWDYLNLSRNCSLTNLITNQVGRGRYFGGKIGDFFCFLEEFSIVVNSLENLPEILGQDALGVQGLGHPEDPGIKKRKENEGKYGGGKRIEAESFGYEAAATRSRAAGPWAPKNSCRRA